jgi:hypothetical protein
MKRALVPFQRHYVDGKLFLDAEGCFYIKPATHPALAGRQFANFTEAMQHLSDFNREHPRGKFEGELILQEVFHYYGPAFPEQPEQPVQLPSNYDDETFEREK